MVGGEKVICVSKEGGNYKCKSRKRGEKKDTI